MVTVTLLMTDQIWLQRYFSVVCSFLEMLFHFGFASNPGDRKKHLKTPCAQLGGDSKGMSNKVKTFAQVRTQKTSSFRTVDHVVQEQAIAVATETAATYQLYVENPQQFSFPDAIFVNDQVGTILDMDSHSLVVKLADPLADEVEDVTLVQRQCHFGLKTVFQKHELLGAILAI